MRTLTALAVNSLFVLLSFNIVSAEDLPREGEGIYAAGMSSTFK